MLAVDSTDYGTRKIKRNKFVCNLDRRQYLSMLFDFLFIICYCNNILLSVCKQYFIYIYIYTHIYIWGCSWLYGVPICTVRHLIKEHFHKRPLFWNHLVISLQLHVNQPLFWDHSIKYWLLCKWNQPVFWVTARMVSALGCACSDESHCNFSFLVRGKITKQCP